MKKLKFSWGGALLVFLILSVIVGLFGWVIYDKLDWLTLIMLFGFVVLAGKLDKISELLEKKKK